MDTEGRRRALATSIGDVADAYLTTKVVNVRYLTGFTGSNAALLVDADGAALLATDGRYATQAAQQAPDLRVVVARRLAGELLAHAAGRSLKRIGIERHAITLTAFDEMRSAADERLEFVDAGECVEALRAVKDEAEIALLKEACRITDAAFAAVITELRPGLTEVDVDWQLREQLRRHGAEPAFDSIVAFGPDSARPHHSPTDRALAKGDLVKMDFGACVEGYHADMTRTICCGPAQDWQRDLHALVGSIQQEARAEIRPGAVPVELDASTRARIEQAGYDVAHGLGHGLGLEIHESPFLVPGSTADRLVDRVAVTAEPGIYLPGKGGVRIEDTMLVSANGAESLTAAPRELIEI